ncbi:MAG: GNAT family N-acetyltransferase [Thermomicrobiales bacterium]|nr:MAG: GNAT family N-acetyltransferase [Thermomicrobiales bacterium]
MTRTGPTAACALQIEEAALRAWPAAQQYLYGGWVARVSEGYTKRANSASLLYPQADADHHANVERIEQLYRAQGLPPVFRLLSFTTPPGLDSWLAARGYREADGTLVMSCDIGAPPPLDSSVVAMSVDEGIEAHARMINVSAEILPSHRRILERVQGGLVFAGLVADDTLVACGLSVTDGELVGLFDIVTDPDHRRKGHGARLVRGMMASAAREGAMTAYLQVVATNAPAIALYEALGFEPGYRYAYRISG